MSWSDAEGRWNSADRIRVERLFRAHVQSRRNPTGRIVRLPRVFWGGVRGRWPQPQPADCLGEPADAHHVDYDAPFRIVWLCFKCHRKVEREKLKITPRMVCDYTSLVANIRRVSARERRVRACGTADGDAAVSLGAAAPSDDPPPF
jgi:hypothetical protein